MYTIFSLFSLAHMPLLATQCLAFFTRRASLVAYQQNGCTFPIKIKADWLDNALHNLESSRSQIIMNGYTVRELQYARKINKIHCQIQYLK